MRLLLVPFILAATTSAAAQNNSTVIPASLMGVFARVGAAAAKHKIILGSVRLREPLAVFAEVTAGNATIGHARTKAGLRDVGRLPAVRVYEAGYITSIATPRARAVGTATGTIPTKGYRTHSWLLRYSGSPGERLRIHMRTRSTRSGTSTITGIAAVDVGNDGSFEFKRDLDGRKYLGNHAITLGSSGVVDVKIVTAALLTSRANTAAAYTMTLDVSAEPLPGMLSSFARYGPLCGADVYGVSWVTGTQRRVRLILENSVPRAPAMLLVGGGRIEFALPGIVCRLLTLPVAVVPFRTDPGGRIITDFPTFPAITPVKVQFQYGVRQTNGSFALSKGIEFRVFRASSQPYRHFDINQILSTGQSLCLGGLGTPVLSKTQRYKNLMFADGLQGRSPSFKPLVERTWETMSSGMASLISVLHRQPYNNQGASKPRKSHDVLVSVHGKPGLPYVLLKKGTVPFSTGITQFRTAQFVASSTQRSHVVRCVTNVHGETDHTLYNVNYSKDLLEWQADYEREIQSRGQTEPVPMLHTQMSSHTRYGGATSIIPDEQLNASVAFPRRIPLVGPKYQLNYVDGVHLTSTSYRHMGEYYGKVYNRMFIEGGTWEPLRPLSIKRTRAVIRVWFHVPEPPLVLDTSLVSNPGDYGFEYWDSSGNPPTIKSVRLIDEDSVEITLSRWPAASARKVIRYAYTGKPGAKGGPRTGARGNLRDSDRTPSLHQSPMFNWAVHFSAPVN